MVLRNQDRIKKDYENSFFIKDIGYQYHFIIVFIINNL